MLHATSGYSRFWYKVKHGNQLDSEVAEERRKFDAPIADGGMRNLDIKGGAQDQADISEGVFSKTEHGKGCDDEMNGIPHSLNVCFSEQRGHGRSRYSGSLPGKEGMVAAFVPAAAVAVLPP